MTSILTDADTVVLKSELVVVAVGTVAAGGIEVAFGNVVVNVPPPPAAASL